MCPITTFLIYMNYTQDEIFQRFILCKGKEAFAKLQQQRILIIGLGAVGGYAAETLARNGVKNFCLVDFDSVDVSNINRQIIATTKTIGKAKVELMKQRILDINPEAEVEIEIKKLLEAKDFREQISAYKPSIVIDCFDMYIQKIELIKVANEMEVVLISSMGAARKNDPSKIVLQPLQKVQTCPLAKKIKNVLKI